MADIFDKYTRSNIMAKVKSINTKPEILVRKFLFANGFRYRLNDKRYPGKPDIVLPKYKTIIFIHGCFWHGHNVCGKTIPASNTEYWTAKIARNIARDQTNKLKLKDLGWNVITLWECEIKNKQIAENALKILLAKIITNKIN